MPMEYVKITRAMQLKQVKGLFPAGGQKYSDK